MPTEEGKTLQSPPSPHLIITYQKVPKFLRKWNHIPSLSFMHCSFRNPRYDYYNQSRLFKMNHPCPCPVFQDFFSKAYLKSQKPELRKKKVTSVSRAVRRVRVVPENMKTRVSIVYKTTDRVPTCSYYADINQFIANWFCMVWRWCSLWGVRTHGLLWYIYKFDYLPDKEYQVKFMFTIKHKKFQNLCIYKYMNPCIKEHLLAFFYISSLLEWSNMKNSVMLCGNSNLKLLEALALQEQA